MGAMPISTLQLPSPPAPAGADAAVNPGALPAGSDGDFHTVLSRNLAGQGSDTSEPAIASAMLAAEDDGKVALSALLFSDLAGYASGTKGQAGASTLPAVEDVKTFAPAIPSFNLSEYASGTTSPADASTLFAAEDGKTSVPAVLSSNLVIQALGDNASEDGKVTDEVVQDEPAKDVRVANEDALALLVALPQRLATPDSQAASPALAGRGPEGIGGERAPGAGLRTADSAVSGAKLAPTSEPGLALRADPEKTVERLVHGAEPLPDTAPAPAPHGTHGALPAGHAPVASPSADPAAAGPAPAPAARHIETPLGAPGWSTALADRLVMFAGERQQTAELHINPPHLGPVDITLKLADDKASVVFASPHAIVRETIESALPRLREVLAESGINLGQASVTADSPRDGSAQAQSRSSFGSSGGRGGAEHTPLGASALAAARHARGLVDLFA